MLEYDILTFANGSNVSQRKRLRNGRRESQGWGAEDIYAIRDVSKVENYQFITCNKPLAYLSRALATRLNHRVPAPNHVSTSSTDYAAPLSNRVIWTLLTRFRLPRLAVWQEDEDGSFWNHAAFQLSRHLGAKEFVHREDGGCCQRNVVLIDR